MLAGLILTIAFTILAAHAQTGPSGFESPIQLSPSSENSTIPQLAVSGNDVYLAWIYNGNGEFGAKFARSVDGGSTFGQPQDLGLLGGAPDNIRIAAEGESVVAVWQSFSENKSSIILVRSSNSGATFSSPIRISSPSADAAFPQVAINGTHVYVAWLERTAGDITNVLFAKSDNGGQTFGSPVSITDHGGNSGIPKIYAYGSNVYLIWEDNSAKNFDIFLSKSEDFGGTFDSPVNISANSGNSGVPQMAVADNAIYAVWMDDSSGHFDIYFAKSTDGGKIFAAPLDVSNGTQDAGYPQLAVYGQNVYVTWTNTMNSNNYDVFFSKSTDGGRTFGKPINISDDPGASGWPLISADGDIYVSWLDNSPGRFDVYIAKSTDNGETFEPPVDVSSSTYGTWYGQMSISSGTVYLAWLGVGNQSNGIMFSKSTTFVPEFGTAAMSVLAASTVAIVLAARFSKFKLK